MTDYNDGKWHGWNGGECPVHPKSVVEVCSARGAYDPGAAEFFEWDNTETSLPIRAFRVVQVYREPRTFWAVGRHLHESVAEAEDFRKACHARHPEGNHLATPIIKLVEVLE